MSKSTNANGNFERRIFVYLDQTEWAISLRSPGNKHWKDQSGDMYARTGIIDHNDPDTREWILWDVVEGKTDSDAEARATEIATFLKAAFLFAKKEAVTVSKSSANPQDRF